VFVRNLFLFNLLILPESWTVDNVQELSDSADRKARIYERYRNISCHAPVEESYTN
jgi:hypothetical protein